MPNTVTLRPGARGTRHLVQKYGNKLICVRYRYDREKKQRVKTVELIEDSAEWQPRINNVESRISNIEPQKWRRRHPKPSRGISTINTT